MFYRRILLIFITFFVLMNAGFCCEKIEEVNGIYHITIPNSQIKKVKFILTENLETNVFIHNKFNSKLTINTGFFDPKNQKTISYIYSDGNLLENPLLNENLTGNKAIMNNWDKISNRGEFRIVNKKGNYIPLISNHNDSIDGELITSAQGGPILLPYMDLEKEFFIQKNKNGSVIRESASVLHKTARTVIGIKDNDIHLLIITDKNPMTIYETQQLCRYYGLTSALAFDGGSSTSFNYKNKINVISTGIKSDNTGRKLKSFMILK